MCVCGGGGGGYISICMYVCVCMYVLFVIALFKVNC